MEGNGEDVAALAAELLRRIRDGDAEAKDELFTLVYDELHRLARGFMRAQDPGHTLQATALVNEAWCRLSGNDGSGWKDRQHFIAVAANSMRSVLVDHARAKHRQKRDPGGGRVPLDRLCEEYEARSLGLVELDAALERLGRRDPRLVHLVELRFFAGLENGEAARVLGLSERQAFREWHFARQWLQREMRS